MDRIVPISSSIDASAVSIFSHVKCQMSCHIIAKCQMSNAISMSNVKYQMSNVKCQSSNIKCQHLWLYKFCRKICNHKRILLSCSKKLYDEYLGHFIPLSGICSHFSENGQRYNSSGLALLVLAMGSA